MPYYRRRTPDGAIPDPLTGASALAVPSTVLTRRLLPFPGSEGRQADVAATLGADRIVHAVAASDPGSIPPVVAEGTAVPRAPLDQAVDLLPRAAGILDEEMARGALAAKSLAPVMSPASSGLAPWLAAQGLSATPTHGDGRRPGAGLPLSSALPDVGALSSGGVTSATGSADLAKDLYAFVDRFAALLPRHQPKSEPEGAATLPVLRADKPVRAGETTTLSLQLTNDEAHPLVLKPVATALISESGAQMPAQCVSCVPASVTLAPGQGEPLTITITVPAGTASGRYAGLIVLAGAVQLRAVTDVEVTAALT